MTEAPEEKLRLSRAAETPPFSWQQVRLPIKETPPGDDAGWKSYELSQRTKTRRRRRGGIAVGSLATRLIQRERTGAVGQ